MPAGTIETAYLAWHAVSALVTASIGAWVYTSTDVDGRRVFTLLMGVDATWVLTAGVEIAASGQLAFAAVHARELLSVTAAFVWFFFAATYTGRSTSIRELRNAVVVASYVVVGLGLLTNPFHGTYWHGLVPHAEPFFFYELVPGPLMIGAIVYASILIGVGVYYLGELFLKSRHRSSTSVLVLVLGALAASCPFVVSSLGYAPVPAWGHASFGVLPFVTATAYSIFGLGMFDMAPVARDVLVDHVDDAILVVDEERRIVDFNRTAGEIAPALHGSIGETLGTVVPSLAMEIDFEGTTEETTSRLTIEVDGRPRDYSALVSPITDDEQVVGYAVVLRDITDLEEYRRELERQNEQLDKFASTVSHDLRNPLQVATGHVERVRWVLEDLRTADAPADRIADGEASLDSLDESLDRMNDIVSDLRLLAKRGQSIDGTEPVPFREAVLDAASQVDTDGATLSVTGDGTIEAKRSYLRSVFENLLRNSVEHSDEPVEITVALTADGFVYSDDGPGIPEGERAAAFEYGYSTSDQGTGLGLAIVETMIESHGWSVTLDSAAGAGVRFVVTGAVTAVRKTDSTAVATTDGGDELA